MILLTPFRPPTNRTDPAGLSDLRGDFVSVDEAIQNLVNVELLPSSRAHSVTSSVAPHALPFAILEPKRALSIVPIRTMP
jgi:hypothetical protein